MIYRNRLFYQDVEGVCVVCVVGVAGAAVVEEDAAMGPWVCWTGLEACVVEACAGIREGGAGWEAAFGFGNGAVAGGFV